MESFINLSLRRISATLFTGLLMFVSVGVSAAPESKPEKSAPVIVVESLTTQLLDLARAGQDKMKNDPEHFFAEIEKVLEPMVSFKFIARNVMGDAYWKQATEAQREQFLVVFKRSLVETYVKGMSQNMDFSLEVLQDQSKITKSKASIVQKITGPDSTNHVVYTLGQGRSGTWKVLNVVLDGVNLGKTFRSQFAQGVKENKGDIQAAISNWAKS